LTDVTETQCLICPPGAIAHACIVLTVNKTWTHFEKQTDQ